MQADIVLSGHPDTTGILERQAQRADGDEDAFVDPGLLARLVDAHKESFEDALSKARSTPQSP